MYYLDMKDVPILPDFVKIDTVQSGEFSDFQFTCFEWSCHAGQGVEHPIDFYLLFVIM